MNSLNFDEKLAYKRIDRNLVILERDDTLYVQIGFHFRDIPLHDYGDSHTHKTLAFSDIKPTDNIYAFDDPKDIVRLIKDGKCLNRTNKVNLNSMSIDCRFRKVMELLGRNMFVGCEIDTSMTTIKARIIKDNEYWKDKPNLFNKNGNLIDVPDPSMGTDSMFYKKCKNFVYTSNEYEFWSWLNS